MDDIEHICRLMCEVDDVDPDRRSIGSGGTIPKNKPYVLWEARKQYAQAIVNAGYSRPSHAD